MSPSISRGGTHRIYAGIMSNHWIPALGPRTLAAITRVDICKMITEKIRLGMSHTTVEHLVTALQSCPHINEEVPIPRNPLRNHSIWLLKRGGSRATPKTVEIFTSTQVTWILAWFAQAEPVGML
jgi:hypothetical protein